MVVSFSFFFFRAPRVSSSKARKVLKKRKRIEKKRTIVDRRLIQGYLLSGIAVCGQASKIYKTKSKFFQTIPPLNAVL